MTEDIHKKIERKLLFNPGPATTSSRVKRSLLVSDICPREQEFGELLDSVRKKLVNVVSDSQTSESILIPCSGTGTIESCLSACADRDDHILIVENGAYGKRMVQICETLGIHYQVIRFEWGDPVDLNKLEDFLLSTSVEFRVLAFVHHETTTGLLNPLEKVTELAKKYNLVTLVDAMSSFAAIPIDMDKGNVDYLITSSNKCLHGFAGLGIVVAKRAELDKVKDFHRRSFYLDLYGQYISQKEKGQFAFTPPVQILYALNEALNEFFEEGGVIARSEHYSKMYQKLFNGMLSLGFTPFIEESHNSKVLTTFHAPDSENYSFEEMHDFFFFRGMTIYPGKVVEQNTFRLANIGDLKEKDIETFLKGMKDYLQSAKIQLL